MFSIRRNKNGSENNAKKISVMSSELTNNLKSRKLLTASPTNYLMKRKKMNLPAKKESHKCKKVIQSTLKNCIKKFTSSRKKLSKIAMRNRNT